MPVEINPIQEATIDYAIIDKSTRVIVGITTDANAKLLDTWDIVQVEGKLTKDPEGDTLYWKLDDRNQKVAATKEEAYAAQVPELQHEISIDKYNAYIAAIDAVINDPKVADLPASITEYFINLRKYVDGSIG